MRIQKVRYEHFGGIVATEDPVSLAWVDRDYLRARGFAGGAIWSGEDPGYLRAPLEMEIAIGSRCNLCCPCCYTTAKHDGRDVPETQVVRALQVAAEMEVFHVAFGGGEPLLHPGLLSLAREARARNLLPALTTNGTLVTEQWGRAAHGLFARVNVSVDVPGGPRDPHCSSDVAWRAVKILRQAGVACGVNFIMTSRTFDLLPQVFEGAAKAGADSVLLLRLKPAGRGSAVYDALRLSSAQQKALLATALGLSKRHHVPFHLDCALAPLLMTAGRSSKILHLLGATGCIAGQLLVTVDLDGMVQPCSHLDLRVGPVEDLPELWRRRPAWGGFGASQPALSVRCATCAVADLCRGGCAAVKNHHGLSLAASDPDIACQPK